MTTLLVDKQGRESLTKCNGCGMYRLCREYEGLWLCVDGPSKCYRRRRTVKTSKDRREP